jgi:hypothetical protein
MSRDTCMHCHQGLHRGRCACPWLPDDSPPVRLGAVLTQAVAVLPDSQPFLPAKAMARLAAQRLRAGDLAQGELAASTITSTYAAPLPPEVLAQVAEVAAQIRYLQGTAGAGLVRVPSGARRRRRRGAGPPGQHPKPPAPRFAEAPPPPPFAGPAPAPDPLLPAQQAPVSPPPVDPAGPDYGTWVLLGVLGVGLGLAGWSDRKP